MDRSAFRRFVKTLIGLMVLAVLIGSVLTDSPDPLSMLFVAGPLVALSPVVAYWLVYRGGYRRLRRAV